MMGFRQEVQWLRASGVGVLALAVAVLTDRLVMGGGLEDLSLWLVSIGVLSLGGIVLPVRWGMWKGVPYIWIGLLGALAGWLVRLTGGGESPWLLAYLLLPFSVLVSRMEWRLLGWTTLVVGGSYGVVVGLAGGDERLIAHGAAMVLALGLAAFTGVRVRAREVDLQKLLELLEAIPSMDLDTLLTRFLASFSRGIRIAAIDLLVVEGDELVHAWGRAAEKVGDWMRLPIGEGVVGRAAQERRLIYVPDVRKEPEYVEVYAETRSELALPLFVGEQLVGVLNLESPMVRGFSAQDRWLLSAISVPLAVAVRNARMAERIVQVADMLASASEELANSSAAVMTSGEEIAAVMHEISSDAARQSDGVKEVAQALERLVSATDRIAQAIDAVHELAVETQNRMAQSHEALHTLEDQITQVGQIARLVDQLAEETHLVALNAAIEAARVGEAGRGFAVVADEVRSLAERSAQAVSRIERISEEVAASLLDVRETTQETRDAIAQVEERVREVVGETAVQREGSVRIARSFDEAAQRMENSVAVSEEVTASVESQAAALEEVATSAETLAKLSSELQELAMCIGGMKGGEEDDKGR